MLVSSYCAARWALTERSISFHRFPSNRPFWPLKCRARVRPQAPVQGRQLGREEEKRGAVETGWAVVGVLAVTRRCPGTSVGCFLWVQTQPLLGRVTHLPSCVGGGSCFQGAPQVLAFISISRTPWGSSHESLSLAGNPVYPGVVEADKEELAVTPGSSLGDAKAFKSPSCRVGRAQGEAPRCGSEQPAARTQGQPRTYGAACPVEEAQPESAPPDTDSRNVNPGGPLPEQPRVGDGRPPRAARRPTGQPRWAKEDYKCEQCGKAFSWH